MQIHTSRFGSVAIQADDVINFPEGLLGFNELRQFVLLDDPSDEIFAWLQSCEEPNIAFPLLEPELFAPSYVVQLSKHDLEVLNLETSRGTPVSEGRVANAPTQGGRPSQGMCL